MVTSNRFSDAEIRGMEVMREQGKSYLDIAISFGVSTTTIKNALNRASQKWKPKKNLSCYSDLRNDQKRKIEEGWMAYKSYVDIAEYAECTTGAVTTYLNNDRLRFVETPKFDIAKIRERTMKEVEKKRGKKYLKKLIPSVPCPFESCSDRSNCTEINAPQSCRVWLMTFGEDE